MCPEETACKRLFAKLLAVIFSQAGEGALGQTVTA